MQILKKIKISKEYKTYHNQVTDMEIWFQGKSSQNAKERTKLTKLKKKIIQLSMQKSHIIECEFFLVHIPSEYIALMKMYTKKQEAFLNSERPVTVG